MAIDLTTQLATLTSIYQAQGTPLPQPAVVVGQTDSQISLQAVTPKGRSISVTFGSQLTPTQILAQVMMLIEQTDAA